MTDATVTHGESAPERTLVTPALILQGFIILQIVAQLAILVPGLSGARLLARGGVFAASLALLILVRGRRLPHPAQPAALAVLAIVGIALFHPDTSSPAAGAAQFGMYLAIIGPLFWVTRLSPDLAAMRRCLMMLWAFHLLSAIIGILQVYYPGSLQPQLSPVIVAQGRGYVESLKIMTSSGVRVFRPMGLTDIPGGAASAGFTSAFLGIGFFLTARGRAQSAAAVASVVIGLVCLYLSQVRAMLVMTLICAVALAVLLLLQRDIRRALSAGLVLGIAIVVGFQLAYVLAGGSVSRRVQSLTATSPVQVYQTNRGNFLEYTVNELLPRYPLGAGLGRWGMMNMYFGGDDDPGRAPLWAEIQWTAWLLDGGIPLIIAYLAALLIVFRAGWRISLHTIGPDAREVKQWAVLMLAYGTSILALTFSYPVFISQAGMEFWLLNAMLYAAATRSLERSPTE